MVISMKNMDPQSVAERAVRVIGFGYDLTNDIRLSSCKYGQFGSSLIEIDQSLTRDLELPGGITVPNVPISIRSDMGERIRFRSDILSFTQMSELFNQDLSLSGKIPCGHFNTMFNFKGCWQKDAASTKSLAFDGCFISLYAIELTKSQLTLSEEIKQEVPTSWDPAALAAFIERYGTHIVVGVKIGGKDVIHIKQLQSSNLQPAEVQNLLKELADKKFSDIPNCEVVPQRHKDKLWSNKQFQTSNSYRPLVKCHSKNNDIHSIVVQRGGVGLGSYNQWLSTISESPNVLSMSFVPITSLLSGVQGCGFLAHAINLYLRYKPPIAELAEFLEYQLPRQWAPAYGDLPLSLQRKKTKAPLLSYALMRTKLYINVAKVDTRNRPVTGIRLFLEGKRSNCLAIHVQHLSTIPNIIHISDNHHNVQPNDRSLDRGYIEPIKWSIFSHVCTAPVEAKDPCPDTSVAIVTKAWFEVKPIGMKKVLFLRLGFSLVASAKHRRSEWDGPSTQSQKSGLFSNLISGRISGGLSPAPEPKKPDINSAVYPNGPPAPAKAPKLASIVDTREAVRGPEDHPGYWVVTGAKLCMDGGKIGIKAKYSLLTILSGDCFSMPM